MTISDTYPSELLRINKERNPTFGTLPSSETTNIEYRYIVVACYRSTFCFHQSSYFWLRVRVNFLREFFFQFLGRMSNIGGCKNNMNHINRCNCTYIGYTPLPGGACWSNAAFARRAD